MKELFSLTPNTAEGWLGDQSWLQAGQTSSSAVILGQIDCDSPRSWRWSGSGRVWGVWGGCRVCCSSGCTRDSEGRLSPPSVAGCCCCTGTTQGPITRSLVCSETETTHKSNTCSILLCSCPNRKLIYLIKYAELLPRLTLDLLFLCLNVCAGWFFHCWEDKNTDGYRINWPTSHIFMKKIDYGIMFTPQKWNWLTCWSVDTQFCRLNEKKEQSWNRTWRQVLPSAAGLIKVLKNK